jgi:hypothetical protein
MKPRNLILFVLLIISSGLFAQKRVQRPRPAKQAVLNVEDFRNELKRDAIPVTVDSRVIDHCTPSRLTSINSQEDQWITASNGQLDRQTASSMVDRFTNPGSGAPDVNHPKSLSTLERVNGQGELIKLGVGDLSVPSFSSDDNN